MTPEPGATFRVMDKRHSATPDAARTQRYIPVGYRPHSVLLGHHSEDRALQFLRDKAVHADSVGDLMQERERAQSRIPDAGAARC